MTPGARLVAGADRRFGRWSYSRAGTTISPTAHPFRSGPKTPQKASSRSQAGRSLSLGGARPRGPPLYEPTGLVGPMDADRHRAAWQDSL